MCEKKPLPIGNDDFRKVRENGCYYVDKTLMIQDFIEMKDETALIARPRRFGKTLNMTMLREFFDITKDSRKIFQGLAIMDTAYASQINSKPVIYLSFKNCKGASMEELLIMLRFTLQEEFARYEKIFQGKIDASTFPAEKFYETCELLKNPNTPFPYMASSLLVLSKAVHLFYHQRPIMLIDEYDQPIMSSYEYGYHEQLGAFFSNLYGSAFKGNPSLGQALLTGVQRVAKESIFSQFNNPQVYTVMDKEYAPYFGLNHQETKVLLENYGFQLDEKVQSMYDGYQMGSIKMYNPWSIINYAKRGTLDNYWIKTSANFLVKSGLKKASQSFWDKFQHLACGEEVKVWITLDTSFAERESLYSLWGLLVNAGYLTVTKRIDTQTVLLRIPNGEVMSEFQILVAELSGIDGLDLQQMFFCLIHHDMEAFFKIYQSIVLSCTSYMDARENAYHMLFLGMCITLRGTYKVTSNLESGYGRSDITLESLTGNLPHIIIEFKQGEDVEKLKEDALEQILSNQYYTGLKGEVICVGLAHDKKRCQMTYRTLHLS
ncbi:MAG: AAA family ATPase [Lachnospiraceae bacterium]|nr:AAA family ATPase [Lachnospiraceae bacterium]